MGEAKASRRWHATAAAWGAAAIGLSGPAQAATLSPPVYGGELELGIHLLVGGVLLVTGLCTAWLLWLMLTSPPEAGEVKRPAAAPPAGGSRLRAWIGARLGHPGPL